MSAPIANGGRKAALARLRVALADASPADVLTAWKSGDAAVRKIAWDAAAGQFLYAAQTAAVVTPAMIEGRSGN